ncbi:MAG TPA: hypothetical protein DCZ76_00235 [Treponema sp.]|nr:hypothetical protein [Treponema sp.]
MEDNTIHIGTDSLLREIPSFAGRGITEFSLHDRKAASDRTFLLAVAAAVLRHCPELFISLEIDAKTLDQQLVRALGGLCCSVEIPLAGTEKGGALLFDKKLYSGRAALLNREGLVFGFLMGWGCQPGDTFRAFRDRLDFALTLYPNHINFPQFADEADGRSSASASPKPTGTYSSKDLDFSRGISFACRTFYTCGRAVPWFNSVTKALKVYPSAFFSDFDEWQQCNNCSFITDYVPEDAPHTEIEKMQLSFLSQKFEEKHKEHLFAAVKDLVQLNGAFSRVAQEGEESIIQTSYNPDDLLSPYSQDIARFADSTAMEMCRVKVFAGADSPDYKIL